jgi:membrane-associated phospholipid phosphatase
MAQALHRWQQGSLFLLANVIASGLFADLIKILCGRPRPKVFFGQHQYSFSFFEFSVKMWSFPSGHATTIFAAMTTASLLAPRGRWLWFSLATVVAICRVLGGAHFPSDILAGAFIGVASSLLLRDYFQDRRLLDFPATAAAPGRFKRLA